MKEKHRSYFLIKYLVILAVCFGLSCGGLKLAVTVTEPELLTPEDIAEYNASICESFDTDSLDNAANEEQNAENGTNNTGTAIADNEFTVEFLDVGQADSILGYETDASGTVLDAFLIDAGNNNDGQLIADYLKNLNIETLNYVVTTHADEDHCGGIDTIIENFQVDCIMLPNYSSDTKTYKDVVETAENSDAELISPYVGYIFDIGDAEFTVLSCDDENNLSEYEGNSTDTNASSIVIRMVYGDVSFMFTGDAITNNEENMLSSGYDLESTVLKVAHHGSLTSNSVQWISAVSPEIAVISVGEDNSYGLPKDKVLERLDNTGAEILRTDERGTIVISTDGENYLITYKQTMTDGGQNK